MQKTSNVEELQAIAKQTRRYIIEMITAAKSGHPGGSLSTFTFAYEVSRRRDPAKDEALRFSAGHLSLLAYNLEWLFGRDGGDARLASPAAIAQTFRTVNGLPGHVEAGVGDIPFGTGVWKHIAVTYDGSTLRQYVDGVLDALRTRFDVTLTEDAAARETVTFKLPRQLLVD